MATDARVAVIGLGYVGLPLAISFAEAGLAVEGVDASADRVAALRAGRSPIDDIADERLTAALALDFRVAGPDDAPIGTCDVIVVCVPTPITSTKDPDLGPVLAAAAMIRGHLRAGHLVILQSTTFPGTTTGPFCEELERDGLHAGVDFDLAYAPERVNPGDPASAARAVPRLVGGGTDAATARAAALLRKINDQVIEVSSPDAAELAKLLENVFRNVNIALVNQLALLCERMGLDAWEVIDAAATKPFGFMRFTPGPGVGGHCIPVDPVLPVLAGARVRLRRPLRRAGRRHQPDHAPPRGGPDRRGTQRPRPSRSRAPASASSGSRSSRTCATSATPPRPTSSPAWRVAGRTSASTTPTSPGSATPTPWTGTASSSASCSAWADAIVVVTAHRAIDWDQLYREADLVVDTVNSSASRPTRDRQVLRLGAGWSTAN